jgi:hypothetical protein
MSILPASGMGLVVTVITLGNCCRLTRSLIIVVTGKTLVIIARLTVLVEKVGLGMTGGHITMTLSTKRV